MYYWNEDAGRSYLEEELLAVNNVRHLQIGTAFFSREGLRILKKLVEKNCLKKENVILYLSDEFSQDNPHELLKEASKLAQISIFFHRMYHAKVYLLRGDIDKLIYGSSNFTAGGFYKNIEFDNIEEIGREKVEEIEHFFRYCALHSTKVTEEVIQCYESLEEEIKELKRVQKELKEKIKGVYSGIFEQGVIDIGRMLQVHDYISPRMQELGLYCSTDLSFLEGGEKSKNENVTLNSIQYKKRKKNAGFSAPKLHREKGNFDSSNLQFTILPSGFIIRLFLAEQYDSMEQIYIKSKINELQPKITREISKLKGSGIKWVVFNRINQEERCFEIDKEKAEDFCTFLKEYGNGSAACCLTGYYSFETTNIKSSEEIGEEIFCHMMMLRPFYELFIKD